MKCIVDNLESEDTAFEQNLFSDAELDEEYAEVESKFTRIDDNANNNKRIDKSQPNLKKKKEPRSSLKKEKKKKVKSRNDLAEISNLELSDSSDKLDELYSSDENDNSDTNEGETAWRGLISKIVQNKAKVSIDDADLSEDDFNNLFQEELHMHQLQNEEKLKYIKLNEKIRKEYAHNLKQHREKHIVLTNLRFLCPNYPLWGTESSDALISVPKVAFPLCIQRDFNLPNKPLLPFDVQQKLAYQLKVSWTHKTSAARRWALQDSILVHSKNNLQDCTNREKLLLKSSFVAFGTQETIDSNRALSYLKKMFSESLKNIQEIIKPTSSELDEIKKVAHSLKQFLPFISKKHLKMTSKLNKKREPVQDCLSEKKEVIESDNNLNLCNKDICPVKDAVPIKHLDIPIQSKNSSNESVVTKNMNIPVKKPPSQINCTLAPTRKLSGMVYAREAFTQTTLTNLFGTKDKNTSNSNDNDWNTATKSQNKLFFSSDNSRELQKPLEGIKNSMTQKYENSTSNSYNTEKEEKPKLTDNFSALNKSTEKVAENIAIDNSKEKYEISNDTEIKYCNRENETENQIFKKKEDNCEYERENNSAKKKVESFEKKRKKSSEKKKEEGSREEKEEVSRKEKEEDSEKEKEEDSEKEKEEDSEKEKEEDSEKEKEEDSEKEKEEGSRKEKEESSKKEMEDNAAIESGDEARMEEDQRSLNTILENIEKTYNSKLEKLKKNIYISSAAQEGEEEDDEEDLQKNEDEESEAESYTDYLEIKKTLIDDEYVENEDDLSLIRELHTSYMEKKKNEDFEKFFLKKKSLNESLLTKRQQERMDEADQDDARLLNEAEEIEEILLNFKRKKRLNCVSDFSNDSSSSSSLMDDDDVVGVGLIEHNSLEVKKKKKKRLLKKKPAKRKKVSFSNTRFKTDYSVVCKSNIHPAFTLKCNDTTNHLYNNKVFPKQKEASLLLNITKQCTSLNNKLKHHYSKSFLEECFEQ